MNKPSIKTLNMFYRNFLIYYILITIGGMLVMTLFVYQSNFFKIKTFLQSEIYAIKASHAFEDKNYGEAEIFYKKALLHYPNSFELFYNLGNSFYRQGRYTDAAETYRQLIYCVENKDIIDIAWNNLGNAYYMMGLITESQKAYKKALLENNDDDVIRQNFLYVSRIIKTESKGQRKFTKKKKNDNSNEEKTDKNNSDKETYKLNDSDRPNGPYQLSNKEMQQLLNFSKEKIRVPQATRSVSSNKKNNSNGPDY